jgi:CRISPR-associated endonuclease Csn1
MELMNDANFENIRPYSPMHQEIMKIYEEYAINSDEKYAGKDTNGRDIFVAENTPDDILKISKLCSNPSKSKTPSPSMHQLPKFGMHLLTQLLL